MKKLIKRLFNWIFADELAELKTEKDKAHSQYLEFQHIFNNIDFSVDVHMDSKHQYSPSWAVISIQGKYVDYLKFMNLGVADARYISSVLSQFEKTNNIKIDAAPETTRFLRMESRMMSDL